ncbi:MAG: VWA domain-containing protein [Planctomycetales bacterium]|nr:VWA domain-containing protein [Planctomycetales bacterium]NIM09231.1 VWA domain-containing protein [Planctomycetales bacterium]NIN08702.1 VWA domain-containing protein [Planctomycetales bacterium]NIN77817.1 VWA domain-containing protein [Planctomycetales bacterium]NIO46787.1 VWA domain-containing protein [Planctomycetales bacterium]
MLHGWQWLVLGLVPLAIVALYFLKLKRQPLEVPSTYLWRKSIEDLHVNSLWQRLRRSLLLWLQLLLLLLIAMALLNPSWRATRLGGNRFIFVIDNSASMNAEDMVNAAGKATRLTVARQRVEQLMDAMRTGDAAMIISFSDTANVVKEFTTDQRDLRRALDGLQPTSRRTSFSGALRLAAGLANPGRIGNPEDEDEAAADALPAKMFVFSDFKLPEVADFSLGNLDPQLEMVGQPGSVNVGIVNFSTRRHPQRSDQVQALARLENFGPQPVTVTLELFLNGQSIDVQEARIPGEDAADPGQNFAQVAFTLDDVEAGVLRLVSDYPDALPVDDQAWAVVNPPRRTRVLFVSAGNTAFEQALRTSKSQELAEVRFAAPDILGREDYRREAAAGRYDLVIYDRCQPQEMPRCNTLWIGRLPMDGRWKFGNRIDLPQIIDTERTHPLMQLLDLGNLDILESLEVQPPAGGTMLIESQGGAIFALAPREGFEDAVLGFEFQSTDEEGKDYYNTNWPRRRSFPVFVQEVIHHLANSEGKRASAAVAPGQTYELHWPEGPDQLAITAPDGTRFTVRRNPQNRYSFSQTDQLGVYQVQDGQSSHRFAVNLFDPLESDIEPVAGEAVRIGNVQVAVSSKPQGQVARIEVWKLLALLGLGVLLLEWYIYNRRVYV